MHFTNLLIIMAVAFLAPLVVNALPGLRVPRPCWRSWPGS